MSDSQIKQLLGGAKILGKPRDLAGLAEEGLPKQSLIFFMQKMVMKHSSILQPTFQMLLS